MSSGFKIITMLTRVFAQPVIETIKRRHKITGDLSKSRMANFLLMVGNLHYRYELYINRKLLLVQTDKEMFAKPVNKMVATKKGVELFYESMIYGIVLIVCVYELRKFFIYQELKKAREREKKKKQKQRIRNVKYQQRAVLENLKKLRDAIEKRNSLIESNIMLYEAKINNANVVE